MNTKQLANDIYWVGKVDNRKVPFHRLILERGTTYNSYLLKTEKPTIIDTVDIAFGKEYVENLSQIIELDQIEYIVINHVEPDHAGALPALLNKATKAKVVATAIAIDLLKDMFKLHHREFIAVKNKDTLDIGGKTLMFVEAPYLHTEETMITYTVEDKILFPCDIFSTHIANEELFNDLAKGEYLEDFKVYYNLIMGPHRPYVRDMLKKIEDLQINMIAPSHGYILRDNAEEFIRLYDEMSSLTKNGKDKKVTIIYSTMTGNTTKIAQKLGKGLEEAGIETSIFNLKNADLEEVRNRINESDGLLVGSSTRYADMVGKVEELLKSLELNTNNKIPAAAFGSYGWSGEAILHIEDYLGKIGYTVINQNYLLGSTGVDVPYFPLRVKFSHEKDLDRTIEAGKVFAELVLIGGDI